MEECRELLFERLRHVTQGLGFCVRQTAEVSLLVPQVVAFFEQGKIRFIPLETDEQGCGFAVGTHQELGFGGNQHQRTRGLATDLSGRPPQRHIEESPLTVAAKNQQICFNIVSHLHDRFSWIAHF